ncbi:MAG: hypothetical protein HC769_14515 [Cyanobacteria bacterium CRU_2_1]|nr:hypothetical protein [Cyanobacteria bacterium RU_5_0]NJR59937.1 hypothetical protein [Cyanobacteria bacterium CRU_2_1]
MPKLASLKFVKSGLFTSVAVLLASSGAAFANPSSALLLAQTSSDEPDSTSAPQSASESRFTCESENGQYTVMYHPISQPGESYAWATPIALGGGWSEDRRCNEISRRLESYRPDGLLEMRTSVENGYDIVCVTTEENPSCRIVLTVPPGQDPLETRDRVFRNLTIADSGEQTSGVVTYSGGGDDLLNQIGDAVGDAIGVDMPNLSGGDRQPSTRRDSIDLRPFLDPADGGTGERL